MQQKIYAVQPIQAKPSQNPPFPAILTAEKTRFKRQIKKSTQNKPYRKRGGIDCREQQRQGKPQIARPKEKRAQLAKTCTTKTANKKQPIPKNQATKQMFQK
jgi:hypothetical protein